MRSLLLFVLAARLFAADPAPPGELVRLNGRNVHIHCTGTGDTPVLLVSGIPRLSFHFALVQNEVARFARVCSYDKGGEAWTDPFPRITAGEMLKELDAVVQHVAPNRPAVLVGHSFGGILIRAYYEMRPNKVRGLVLVDTPHPDNLVIPVHGQRKKMYELTEEDMQAAAEFGRKQNAQAPPEPTIQPPFDRLPTDLQQAHLWAMKKAIDASRTLDPLVALKAQSEFAKRIKDQRLNVPTIVITRAKAAEGPDPWVESQQRLAAMAKDGKLVRAVGSGHDIQLEQPALIVQAVRELVAQPGSQAK
jgi:pimeloyl-ACP methyl ester carboxylesterase